MTLLAENLKKPISPSIAFVCSNVLWAKPKPLLQTERANTQPVSALFSVSEVFAVAKVKLLAKAHSEVKLAYFARDKTSLSVG